MALTERLQIIVTADAKGAAREFQKVGAVADRELSRTEDRLEKAAAGLTKWGVQLGLAGGIATVGMFKLAQAAGDYGETVSAAGVIFGEAAEDVEAFGEKASKSAGLSARAAVDAANQFGTFGKAAGLTGRDLSTFSTDLTQLAGDLASFKNTTTEEAVLALGSALRGEAEPLRKYGVLLDDATLKAKATELGIYDGNGALTQQQKILAANAAIWEQTNDAQGDFSRTSESLANQQRTLSAEFENLQRNLGEGAVPVFSELLGGVNGLLDGFQDLDPEIQTLVGRVGAIGAVGLTVGGGLSFLVGQAIGLRDTFRDLGSRMRDAEGNMTRFGNVASTTGRIIGTAGLTFFVYQLADALNEASENTVEFDTALNRILSADTDAQVLDAFEKSLASVEGTFDRARDFFSERDGVVYFDGLRVEVDNLDEALKGLMDNDPEALEKTVAALQAANVELGNVGAFEPDPVGKANEIIDKYAENLEAAGDAADKSGDAAGGATPKVDEFGNAVEESGDQAKTAGERWQEYADAVKAATDPFFAVIDANTKLAEAQGKATEAQAAYNADPTAENLRALEEANYAAVLAARDQELSLIGLAGAVEDGTVSVDDATAALQRWQADGRITATQADLTALAFFGVNTQVAGVSKALDELDGKRANVGVNWTETVPAGSLLARMLSGKPLFGDGGGPTGGTWAGVIASGSGKVASKEKGSNGKREQGRISSGDLFGDLGIEQGRRAAGGPVWPGGSFMVNERGREMFVPSTNGFVMDAGATRDLIAGVQALVAGQSAQGGPMIGEYHVHTTATAPNAEQLASDAKFVKALVG